MRKHQKAAKSHLDVKLENRLPTRTPPKAELRPGATPHISGASHDQRRAGCDVLHHGRNGVYRGARIVDGVTRRASRLVTIVMAVILRTFMGNGLVLSTAFKHDPGYPFRPH